MGRTDDSQGDASRRTVLKTVGGAVVGGVAFGAPAVAKGGGNGGGFPPKGITSWSEPQRLGDGEVKTFASVTPSGEPKYLGVHLSEGALSNPPSKSELEKQKQNGVNGIVENHGVWMKNYAFSLPDDAPEPYGYVGFNWNPQGHGPKGVYTKRHFDVHFYFNSRETIGSIGVDPETGELYTISAEDIEDGQIPEGYRLIEGGTVVPKMGAHLAPEDAPELNGGEWLQTLLWGAADVDDDDAYELNFLEPMITVDYLERHLDGVDAQSIAQPAVYPQDGWYPTTYAVRDLGDGGYAVVLQDFEEREA